MVRKRERYSGFWWENVKETYHFEDLGKYGRIILERDLRGVV
jgi:hypothetical protein